MENMFLALRLSTSRPRSTTEHHGIQRAGHRPGDVHPDRTVIVVISGAFVPDNDYELGTPSSLTVGVTDSDT